MTTNTSERELERLICTALTRQPCDALNSRDALDRWITTNVLL